MFPGTRARRNETGASAVEFALVLPILVYLVFGIIQYSLYFWASSSATSAAREALRRVVVGDCQGYTDGIGQVEHLVRDQVGGSATVDDVDPDWADFSGLEVGDNVAVHVDVTSIHILAPFIPLPNDGKINRVVEGRLEDTEDSGTCE